MVETGLKEELEIITIKNLDTLKAKLEVVGNEADLETKRTKVTIQLEVWYTQYHTSHESLEVYVDISEDQTEKFNEAFEEAKALVSKELDDVKSDLKPSQTVWESFDTSLDVIKNRIYGEVEKFFKATSFEINRSESSGGQALVGS